MDISQNRQAGRVRHRFSLPAQMAPQRNFMQDTRLVVTGMGAVTPVGIGCETYWNSLVAGKSGVKTISRFDTEGLPVHIAATVEDFNAEACLPRHLQRNMALFCQYAFAAATEALGDAQLTESPDPWRTGIVMGTAMDGMELLADIQSRLTSGAIHRVGPRLVPMLLGNMAAGLIAIDRGFHGPSLTINTACSSGGDAIMTAAMLLHSGLADVMLVVGGESIISPIFIASLAQAKALSRRNDAPLQASRPFDKNRDGFVLGEGGGALVLETAEHAARRGIRAYARLAGWGNTQDGYHVTSPDPEGTGSAHSMEMALHTAGLQPEDIGYINAHGTSTPVGDAAETKAIHKVFGTGHSSPAVSSTKGATGHMMGAGGITEIIACIKSLQTGVLPPSLNYETPDPECALNIVGNTSRKADVHAAMSNSLGFGGQNSSIVVLRDSSTQR